MKLSVIVSNYNTPKLTKECVESIYRYKPKCSFEVIVVDDASTDNSVTVLKELEKKFKNLKVLQNIKNSGFVRTNNKGLHSSKGDYKLLLNSDALVHEGTIDNLISFAEKTPDAGAIVPRLLNSDGSTQPSAFRFPSIWGAIKKYWFNINGYLDKYIPDSKTVDVAVMAAFLITPLGFKKAGLLNQKYFMYFEDIDYCKKLKNEKLKIYYENESQVTHYHGESGKHIVDESNQWRRLIPSSIIYHGKIKHYLIYLIMLIGQKFGIYSVLILLFTIPAIWNLLRPGYFLMQDDLQAFRVQQMDKCLSDGQIPCRWVPDAGYGYGYPQFNYYPPTPYYVGAVLHRIGFQYIDSVKILFIAGYILSALTMFLLISELLKNKWAGFVSAALYTYIPYKAVEVYVRGALSEFWAQVFFPLIFYLIYKVIKTGKVSFTISLSVAVALLATTHTLMTIIFAPAAFLWAVYWLYTEKWTNLSKVIWSGLLGFGLSAYYLLPVAFEHQFVHIESMLSGYFDYRAHFVSLYKLFISTEWGYGSSGFPNEKLNLSLGIVQWVIGIGAGFLAIFNYKKNKMFSLITFYILLTTLLSVFMIHMKSSSIWAKLPFLWYMQFPWRFLALSIFLLCLLSGLFIFFSGKIKYVLGVLVITIAIISNISYFVPKDWFYITDADKFSGISWEKQMTISIFDYLPIYAILPPINEAPAIPEIMDGKAEVLEYTKGSDFQFGTIKVLEYASIRLPLFDFPGMVVKVDGKKVEHYNNDCRGHDFCYGLISFKLPTGEHKIEVELTDTSVRKIGNILTLISLGIIFRLMIKSKKVGYGL
ncbi:MAG: glycosyltransferase [Patescibacteria group bacterium]